MKLPSKLLPALVAALFTLDSGARDLPAYPVFDPDRTMRDELFWQGWAMPWPGEWMALAEGRTDAAFLILASLIGGLLLLGVLEKFWHRRILRRIPIRIHVNGTRGKSSVTRLLFGALREAGIVTCAKTTGTLARFITPEGREYPIYRPAGANIGEQIRIIRTAAAYRPEALVIECMALQPAYQWLSEKTFVQATHGVITNARPDHLDVMGPTNRDVALALAGTTPRGGKLFTAERRFRSVFEEAAADRGSEFCGISSGEVEEITGEDLEAFSYREHPENIALVLRLCADLGIDRATALRGMVKAPSDVGALREYRVGFFGRRLVFVNAFAANDPISTGTIWEDMVARHGGHDGSSGGNRPRRIALINCREDRPDRSYHLGLALLKWTPPDEILLIGSGVHAFSKAARGLDPETVHFADGRSAADIFEHLVSLGGEDALIVGMGNIGGPGLELLRVIENRSGPVPITSREAPACGEVEEELPAAVEALSLPAALGSRPVPVPVHS